jgi:hypothetical protein
MSVGLRGYVASLYSLLGKVMAIIFSPLSGFFFIKDWEKDS